MGVVSEISDKPRDLFMAAFCRAARANPEATTGLSGYAIGELLSGVGSVLMVGAGDCRAQPADGFAVASGTMAIRSPLPLCPMSATAIPLQSLLFLGCQHGASGHFSRIRGLVKIAGLRRETDVVKKNHSSSTNTNGPTRQGRGRKHPLPLYWWSGITVAIRVYLFPVLKSNDGST
jgi:hypothetical protein